MASVLVATSAGCRMFSLAGEGPTELPGHSLWAFAPETGGACLAIVDGNEIWRRSARAEWSLVAKSDVGLSALASINGQIYGGSSDEAAIFRFAAGKPAERLTGFDAVPGRAEWFPQGPPLHIRALTATDDGAEILAAVHVGGIPCSTDGGKTWEPTIPVNYDVHEVRAYSLVPIVAAAAAVGLCVSRDGGRNWRVMTDGLETTAATEFSRSRFYRTRSSSVCRRAAHSRSARKSGAGESTVRRPSKCETACRSG